jgi:putative DNA methylase
MPVTPFSLKGAPSLIERLMPVQKLSVEAFKEQMANAGKTLTALGSYWKGRKPLVINRACVLGVLLPATENPVKDLEVFELLMAMDPDSLSKRLRPADSALVASRPYREIVDAARRAEEMPESLYDHIWETVNTHLGTSSQSFPDLVNQLGIMRFGRRPRIADTFSGSGQIPFEAARLGCDAFASDLNPIACLLTWGAFNVVGGSSESHEVLKQLQQLSVQTIQKEIDDLGVESDGHGWVAKAFLYCLEVRCPQTGWMVPLLPSLIISAGKHVVTRLVPDPACKRYLIKVMPASSAADLAAAKNQGTVRTESRGQEPALVHVVDGKEYRTKISTLRGDYRMSSGETGNRLRLWGKMDFAPRKEDIFQERLYAVHWMRKRASGRSWDYEFRGVTAADEERELIVHKYIASHLPEWQEHGWVPDVPIEPGEKTDEPIRTRGWTHWHHLFNARQLLVNGLANKGATSAGLKLGIAQALNWNSKLCRWLSAPGLDAVNNTFDNQALNTLYNYGTRSSRYLEKQLLLETRRVPLPSVATSVSCRQASEHDVDVDCFITDPPYGDAVKYEEILEFFIAWLRKNPSPEFADWVWDSRRALAIKGEDEDFRQGMVAAYKRMTECMPDNGIQVIMFTHQSGSIWADMANIVWASGLQVTAAWYVVTETDSALREGSYVKGTVLLVLRKRTGGLKITRDDLAWEIEEEVQKQVQDLTGLNQTAKSLYRDENVFEDADIQMAGYAAALRVLTRYSRIDGREMATEAVRPRVRGETTFVDELIEFAVATANQCLVPQGIEKTHWDRLTGAERFYLKMLDMESRGSRTLDNYQNFAKAFKVRDYLALLASRKANDARLKSATEFGKTEMGEGSQLFGSPLRAVLYAMWEIGKEVDGDDAVRHLAINIPDYYSNQATRELADALCGYLVKHLEILRPEEASAARVLSQLIKNQRIG